MNFPDEAHQRRLLIVNADDFGVAPGVNKAILDLNEAGVLTSATLMATGSEFRAAVHGAFVQPSLSVGCHVMLIDGRPALHSSEIPTLAGPSGFRPTLGLFVGDLLRGRIREADIEREAVAQITRVQSAGITVTHVDTHKHTHMFPRVLQPLLRAAEQCGVRAIRNPFEPVWAMHATSNAPWQRRLQVRALHLWHGSFRRAVSSAGFVTTDGAFGILATGTLDTQTLDRLISAMPDGSWELVCHPGYPDAALKASRTRLIGTRETERNALLQVIPNMPDLALIGFQQLAP